MAKDQSKRLGPRDLVNDIDANDALQSVEGYTPVNAQYSAANVATLYNVMISAQSSETKAEAAFRTARDKAVAAEWNFHNAILASKDQVKAQFGKDSNELQSLGLKKVSEYKRPTAKPKTAIK